jgi:molybdate/tungstate transport system permease protein
MMQGMKGDRFLTACWVVGGFLIVLIISALLTVAIPEISNLPHLAEVAGESGVLDSIFLTMAAGMVAVLILVLLGTPLGYALARDRGPGSILAQHVVDIPLILPHTVAGIMIYLLFNARAPIGYAFSAAGIFFEDAFPGIVIAMVFVSVPYYVRAAREGFEKVPVRIENVARTLGASRARAFLYIALPLSYRHLASGALQSFGRSVGEFAAVVIIAYFPMVVSTLIYQRFSTGGLAESRSIAFLMILIFLVIFASFGILTHLFRRPYDHA